MVTVFCFLAASPGVFTYNVCMLIACSPTGVVGAGCHHDLRVLGPRREALQAVDECPQHRCEVRLVFVFVKINKCFVFCYLVHYCVDFSASFLKYLLCLYLHYAGHMTRLPPCLPSSTLSVWAPVMSRWWYRLPTTYNDRPLLQSSVNRPV
jgi:hypothetical protein